MSKNYRSDDEIQKIKDFYDGYDWDWVSKGDRKWWVKHCYHYTDLSNIISILREGFLFSRYYLQKSNHNWHDSASASVINKTSLFVKNSVRFYFRPKTPPQYHIEGIQTKYQLENGDYHRQCQIPVLFVFDAVDILSRKQSEFSDGNLGSSLTHRYSNPKDLWKLPWKSIYHNGRIDQLSVREITRKRCAEIIVPKRINLDGLEAIFCRSEAEKEMLLFLLGQDPNLYNRFSRMIASSGKYDLFFRRHVYIENVSYSDKRILLYFSPDAESPGPFDVKVALYDTDRNLSFISEKRITKLLGRKIINIPSSVGMPLILELFIDNYLAYTNIFLDDRDLLSPF